MDFEFSGRLWYWKGPAPHYFLTVPAEHSADIKAASSLLTYGWGMIPVQVQIGETTWKTAMFAKDGLYALPVRLSGRKAERLEEGDEIAVKVKLQ